MPIVLLISFSFIYSSRGKAFYLFFLNLFVSILFLVDIVYARAFDHLTSIYMIIAQGVTEDLNAGIISLIKWTDFLILIDLPIFFWLALKSKKEKTDLKKRVLEFSITVVVSITIICFQFNSLVNTKSLVNFKDRPLVISPLGEHLFDLYRFVYERTDKLNEADLTKIEKWFNDNSKYQDPDENYADLNGLIKGKNLIVIQVESLEDVVVGQSYLDQEITPNINRLIENSFYFNNIYEQVRDGNSSDAELMFNSSIYPINSGSTFLRFGQNTYLTLPELLGLNGYTSIAIHGDDKEFWNRNQAFEAIGFHRYISEEQFDTNIKGGMGILDEFLFSQSLIEIGKLKEPYYLFIITLTSHMPFDAVGESNNISLANDDMTSRYINCINYTDKVFGQFYEKLHSEGILDNSVIILYGDHEGVHKYYATSLQDNNMKIPFIIHVPGIKGQVVNKIGGQIDMMPTLAYLLGMEKGEYDKGLMGRNLFGNSPGTTILANGDIVGDVDDEEHLIKGQEVADLIIRGNYFNLK